MKRKKVLYVRPLGRYVHTVLIAISRRPVDEVVLLPSKQTRSVAEELSREIKEKHKLPVRLVEMDHTSLADSFAKITDVILDAQRRGLRCTVDIGGGMRIASIAGHLAAIFTESEVVYSFSEGRVREVFDVKPIVVTKLPLPKCLIIRALTEALREGKDGLTYDEIRRRLDEYRQSPALAGSRVTTGKPNISRHIRELKEKGYVKVRKGRPVIVELVGIGKVLYNLIAKRDPKSKCVEA